MKFINKLFWIMVGLIACVAISLYLFLKVRDHQSRRGFVHEESIAVVKISVDKILKDITWNAIMNPGYYSRKDTAVSSSEHRSGTDFGVAIPANLYLFALKEDETAWYSWMEVKDVDRIQEVIRMRLGGDSMEVTKEGENWSICSKDKRIYCYGDAKQMLIAFSIAKKDLRKKVVELWDQRADKQVEISTLADFNFGDNDWDIRWQQRVSGSGGGLSFDKGAITSELLLTPHILRMPEQAKVRKLPGSNVLTLYCHADLRPLFEKYAEDIQRYNIPVDSLMPYYGGYLDLQWRAADVLQKDSIVAYDYDDDFNRIEKKEVREEAVPNLSLTFQSSPHLGDYLPEKLFYKFYKSIAGDQLGWSTDPKVQNDYPYTTTDDAVFLSYRSNEAVERHLGWLPQLDRIDRILLTGRNREKRNVFHAEIELKEKRIHALYQLLN